MTKTLFLISQHENENYYNATFAEKAENVKAPEGKIAVKSQITFSCPLSEKPDLKTGLKYQVTIELPTFKKTEK